MANSSASVTFKGRWRTGGRIEGRRGANPVVARTNFELVVTDVAESKIAANKVALEKVVSKTAFDLAERIKVNLEGSPSRPHKRTGDLQRSITVADAGPLARRVFTTMFYAPFVEHGTTRHQAYPFFWPAIKMMQEPFARAIRAVIGKAR